MGHSPRSTPILVLALLSCACDVVHDHSLGGRVSLSVSTLLGDPTSCVTYDLELRTWDGDGFDRVLDRRSGAIANGATHEYTDTLFCAPNPSAEPDTALSAVGRLWSQCVAGAPGPASSLLHEASGWAFGDCPQPIFDAASGLNLIQEVPLSLALTLHGPAVEQVGFADVTVLLRDLQVGYKADVTPLLLVPSPGGGTARATTAVTGFSVASTLTGELPNVYFLAALETSVTCLACGSEGGSAPLARAVYAGTELPSVPNRARYFNTVWQMPEPSLTSDGSWSLDAVAFVLPPGPGPALDPGAGHVAYFIARTFDPIVGYSTQRSAILQNATGTGRAVEAGGEHVYVVRGWDRRLPDGATVPGFELLYARSATANTAVSELQRASFFALDASGAPRAARPVRVEPTSPEGTRFAVIVDTQASAASERTFAIARCELSSAVAGCEVGPDGALLLAPLVSPEGAP